MTTSPDSRRTVTASLTITASPQSLYQAFMEPEALVQWLPPEGMKGKIFEFDAREGGTYRLALTYENADDAAPGKTSEKSDVVSGTFVKLIPNERIVQAVDFESDDPAFAGTMTMTWSFAPVPGGTDVAIVCENVPYGIKKEDHDTGLKMSLGNLAAFMRTQSRG